MIQTGLKDYLKPYRNIAPDMLSYETGEPLATTLAQ